MASRAIKFSHVLVPTDSVDDSAQFYEATLGLQLISVPETGYSFDTAWLEVGGVEVHLVRRDPNLLRTRIHTERFAHNAFNPTLQTHLAFEVDSVSDVRDRVAAQGLRYAEFDGEGPMTRRQIFVWEPSGMIVELYEAI